MFLECGGARLHDLRDLALSVPGGRATVDGRHLSGDLQRSPPASTLSEHASISIEHAAREPVKLSIVAAR
jgi:hypothetical protein